MGDRYAAVDGFCIECPVGCDVCDGSYACSVCLSDYSLANGD